MNQPNSSKSHTKYITALLLLVVIVNSPVHALQLQGRLEWVHKVDLRVLESGIIRKINASIGQHVKKGDLLLQLDQREVKARQLEAKARIKRSELLSEDAKREMDRTMELFDRGLIAEEELKDAELKQAIALAEQESAKAALAAAEADIDETEIRAPFNGIIVSRNVWQGGGIYKTLQNPAPIIIAPDDKMLARALVTDRVLNRFRIGQPAKVTLAGKTYNGKIHAIGVESVRIDPEGAVYELDIIFNHGRQNVMRQAEVVNINLP